VELKDYVPNKDILEKYINSSNLLKSKITKELLPISSSEDIPPEMKEDFIKYLEESDKSFKEIEKIQKEYQEILEKSDEEFKEILRGRGKKEILNKLREFQKQISNPKNIEKIEKFINDIENGINLGYIQNAISCKIKNPSKIMNIYLKNFPQEAKKFYGKLERDSNYYVDPKGLVSQLEKSLGNINDSKLFLYVFFGFFKSKNSLDKYCIFADQVIRNIYRLDDELFEERDEFLNSIKKVVSTLHTA